MAVGDAFVASAFLLNFLLVDSVLCLHELLLPLFVSERTTFPSHGW